MGSLPLSQNYTYTEEETESHAGIADDVKNGADKTIVVVHPNPTDHVADLGHNEVSEHFLNVALSKGHGCGAHDGQDHEPRDNFRPERVLKGKVDSEHGERHPYHDVDHDLGYKRGQQAGSGGGRMEVGVRQPCVKGEEGHLDQHPETDEDEGDLHGGGIGQTVGSYDLLNAHHIQGTRLHVDVAHAQQVEGCPDGAEYDVVESSRRRSGRTHRDETVARKRRHLDEYVKVEGVARQANARQTSHLKQK